MVIRQLNNIMGLELEPNKWLGFHSHNLELAEFEASLWQDKTDLLEWSNEVDPETAWAKEVHFINTLSVNVAQVCNLACTYCAAGGDGTYGSPVKRLDVERFNRQLEVFLKDLPDGEDFSIHFLGGEPLLFPNIIQEIADFTKNYLSQRKLKSSCSFSITTNGTLINTRTARLMADLKMAVTISLDGAKEINDLVRPNKGQESSTDMTLRGLENLKSVRQDLQSLSVNCVFGEHNLGVVDAYLFLSNLSVDWDIYNFNFSNSDKSLYVTTAYISQMSQVADLAASKGGLAELAKIAQFRGPMSRIESKTRLTSYCGAGKSLIQVDTSEDLYPCNWFMGDKDEVIGHGTEVDPRLKAKFEENLIELNDCGTCWARHLCAGGCMAVHKASSGDRHSKDPQFCLRSRSLSALAIKKYYEQITQGEQDESH